MLLVKQRLLKWILIGQYCEAQSSRIKLFWRPELTATFRAARVAMPSLVHCKYPQVSVSAQIRCQDIYNLHCSRCCRLGVKATRDRHWWWVDNSKWSSRQELHKKSTEKVEGHLECGLEPLEERYDKMNRRKYKQHSPSKQKRCGVLLQRLEGLQARASCMAHPANKNPQYHNLSSLALN